MKIWHSCRMYVMYTSPEQPDVLTGRLCGKNGYDKTAVGTWLCEEHFKKFMASTKKAEKGLDN